MATYQTTILTMFFNLKGLKDSSDGTRPLSFYTEHGRETLKLKYPMVIFCDETTIGPLKAIRDEEVGAEVPTEYIVKNIKEYEYYQECWGIIAENRQKSEHYRSRPQDRNTISYCLMGMFKPLAFRIAHDKNFFNTPYYAWIDLGCKHIVRQLSDYAPKMLENPGPRVKACYIHYRPKAELASMEAYMANGGPCGIASTAYTIEANYVNRYYTSMFSIFYEMLLRGVGHTDETTMAYCYDRYPELFTLYWGDYYSVFTNYESSKEDLYIVRRCFIDVARGAGRGDLAAAAAKSVMKAVAEGLALPPDEIAFYQVISSLA